MSAQKITIHGFLNEFKRRHEQMTDRPFCWILGSGASIQSGIPTGKELVNIWLKELHDLEASDGVGFDEWVTADNLGIPGFEYVRAANFYPWVYQRRYRDYKELGYAFLEKTMERAEPSFGYSVLAQIMSTTSHNVAVTTNFDNLIADALSIYTRTSPLVCGHESLTGYIRPNLRRPLIAKIHRDLLLAPLSNPEEIAKLPGEWGAALTKVFERFTPIVVGYGGNDGSLMGFLKSIARIEGGVFWCYREGGEVDEGVHEVIERHHGKLVPIAGFDEVMLQLQEKLQLSSLLPQLTIGHEKRVTNYQKQFEDLTAALRKPADTPIAEEARKPARIAAEAAVERLTKEKSWWAWQLKANAESDPAKREQIFQMAIEDFPGSPELSGNFAVFMETEREDYVEAERLYCKALELDPDDAICTGNFALFMDNVRKNYDEADRFYRKALELDPDDANNTGNFALFMDNVRKNYDEAERLYRKALELNPNDASNTGNFALFMDNVRKNYDEAERLYRKALTLNSNDANNTGNFALFMDNVRKSYDEAERLYRRALQLDPERVNITGAFALFMNNVKRDYEEAERLYRKALELDPNDANNTGNFALFMDNVRKNYDEAERLYRKALELDPNHAINTGNFAVFMNDARKNYDEAERLYRKALELDPDSANSTGNFANFVSRVRMDYDESERLYCKALELDPDHANNKANFAQFLAFRGKLDEANELAIRSWQLLDMVPSETHAEIAFVRWLLDRHAERDGNSALGRLKTVLQAGFVRYEWSFDELLATLTPGLNHDDQVLAHKLSDAIVDDNKVTGLEHVSIWKAVEPIPLDVPWTP
jgi:protein O-mannosyl-transferase